MPTPLMDEIPQRTFHGFVRLLETLVANRVLNQNEAESIIDDSFSSPEIFEPNRSPLSQRAIAKMVESRNR